MKKLKDGTLLSYLGLTMSTILHFLSENLVVGVAVELHNLGWEYHQRRQRCQ